MEGQGRSMGKAPRGHGQPPPTPTTPVLQARAKRAETKPDNSNPDARTPSSFRTAAINHAVEAAQLYQLFSVGLSHSAHAITDFL